MCPSWALEALLTKKFFYVLFFFQGRTSRRGIDDTCNGPTGHIPFLNNRKQTFQNKLVFAITSWHHIVCPQCYINTCILFYVTWIIIT